MKGVVRFWLGVLLWAPCVFALEEVPEPPLEGLEEAVRERLAAARDGLLAAIEVGESSEGQLAELYGNTGMVFNAHHSFEVAEVCYRNASELAPEEDEWVYLLGFLYQDTGRFEEAVASYSRVLELVPDDPLASLRLGESLLNLNLLLEAEPHLLLAAKVTGLQAAALAGLGKIEMARGNLEGAEANYLEAIELQPDADQLYYPLSLVLRRLGRVDEARLKISLGGNSKVTARDSRLAKVGSMTVSSEMFMTSGARAIKAGRLDQAALSFRGAIAARPENARAHLNLAVVLRQLGDLEAAEESARTALAHQPDYFFGHFNLGEILELQGDVEGAEAEYTIALSLDSKHIKANQKMAALRMRRRDFQGAIGHYEVVIEAAPSLVAPRYLLALAWVGLEKVEKARLVVEKALVVHPSEAQLIEASVRLVAIDSTATPTQIAEALGLALAEQKRNPTFSGAEALAMVLAAAGRHADAAAIQQRLVSQLPLDVSPAVKGLFQDNLEHYLAAERAERAWP